MWTRWLRFGSPKALISNIASLGVRPSSCLPIRIIFPQDNVGLALFDVCDQDDAVKIHLSPMTKLPLIPLMLIAAAPLLHAEEPAKQQLKPGSTFYLDFPDLPPTWNNKQKARLGIFLPEDYTPDRVFPLVVWFGAGGGGDNPGSAVNMVGRKGYVCAGVPYNDADGWKTEWSYYGVMLRQIDNVVPNINPSQRVCAGFSSGGAAITYSMGNTKPFQEFFYAFMPGGAGWSMGSLAPLKGRPMLAFMGDKDSRLDGFTSLIKAGETAGMDVKFLKFSGGHDMPNQHFPEIREWLRKKVVQRELPQLLTSMKSDLAAGRHSKAHRAAREVTFITDPDSPEHAAAVEIIGKAKAFGEANATKVLAEGVPLAAKQQFVRDWRGCDFIKDVETQCEKVAESQLERILSQNPVSAAHLKKFISMWDGFPVRRRAIEAFDKMAASQLGEVEQISSPEARNQALMKFVETWSPTESADRAKRMRETLATEELKKITAITAKGTMRSKLNDFIRSYAGTAAEQEARALQGKR